MLLSAKTGRVRETTPLRRLSHKFEEMKNRVIIHRLQSMRILEQVIQEETFDIEVQYCDPDECLHDCIHSGTNNCDAIITGWR